MGTGRTGSFKDRAWEGFKRFWNVIEEDPFHDYFFSIDLSKALKAFFSYLGARILNFERDSVSYTMQHSLCLKEFKDRARLYARNLDQFQYHLFWNFMIRLNFMPLQTRLLVSVIKDVRSVFERVLQDMTWTTKDFYYEAI